MAGYGTIPGNGHPYGSIFSADTPALDQLSNRLYQEQRQQEQQRKKEQAMLDEEFAKNMANIKDIDVPEISKLYGDWKLDAQDIMKSGAVSPERQLANLRKKAEIYKALNSSKAEKQRDEEDAKLGRTHPENLIDEYDKVLTQRRKTPTSQLYSTIIKRPDGREVSLGDYDLMYRGDNYNSAEDFTKSKGSLLPNMRTEGDKDVTYQSYGNTPEQVKQYYLGLMGKRDANKYYRNELMNLPADELTKTREMYEAIPESQFELMGRKKPKLEFNHLENYADTIATYKAMKAAVENVPRKIKEDLTDAAKLKMQAAKEKEVAAFRLGLQDRYQKGLYDYKHAGTAGEKESIVKRLFDDSYNAGKFDTVFIDGKQVAARKIKTLAGLGNLYKKDVVDSDEYLQKDQKPEFYVTADKKYVVTRYPGQSSKEGEVIPINTFLTEMGQAILTRSNNQGEVDNILDETEDDVPYSPLAKTSTTPVYKKSDLIKAGWTESQIKQAKSAGKIKVN